MISRRLRFLAALTLAIPSLFGISTGVISAHAQYGSSTPAANGTVSATPASVQITFTQELSDIEIAVTGPDGSSVTTGQAKFDLAQRHNASVPIRDAGAGVYSVVWHNVSGEDGDSNDGSFVFTVTSATSSTATTPATAAQTTTTPATVAAALCVDNGVHTAAITDVRVDTYCKRQSIRDKYQGQIDMASFNDDLAAGKGLESALSDAMSDWQKEHSQTPH